MKLQSPKSNPTRAIPIRLRVSVNLHPPLRVTVFIEGTFIENTLPTAVTLSERAEGSEVERV